MKGRTPKTICPKILTKFYTAGTPLSEISEFFDCTKATIVNRAKVLGLSHPSGNKNKRATAYKRFANLRVVERYQDGEPLKTLHVEARANYELLREYLIKNGVHLRSRTEQIATAMEKHGTRATPETQLKRAIHKLPDPLGRHLADIYRCGNSPNIRRFAEKYWLPFEMVQKIAYEIRDIIQLERN